LLSPISKKKICSVETLPNPHASGALCSLFGFPSFIGLVLLGYLKEKMADLNSALQRDSLHWITDEFLSVPAAVLEPISERWINGVAKCIECE
jgi:hypothetical protein